MRNTDPIRFVIGDQVEVNETEYPINFDKGHIGVITGTGTIAGCWEIDNLHDVFSYEIKHVDKRTMTKEQESILDKALRYDPNSVKQLIKMNWSELEIDFNLIFKK